MSQYTYISFSPLVYPTPPQQLLYFNALQNLPQTSSYLFSLLLHHFPLTKSLIQFQWARSHLLDPISSAVFYLIGLLLSSKLATTVCFLPTSLSLFLPYYLTIWGFITHQYWSFFAFQPSPPRGLIPVFQWDMWLLSHLKARCVLSSSAILSKHRVTLSISWTWFESYIARSCRGKC